MTREELITRIALLADEAREDNPTVYAVLYGLLGFMHVCAEDVLLLSMGPILQEGLAITKDMLLRAQ